MWLEQPHRKDTNQGIEDMSGAKKVILNDLQSTFLSVLRLAIKNWRTNSPEILNQCRLVFPFYITYQKRYQDSF